MIITGANSNYIEMLSKWEEALILFGYEFAIYDLGGLNKGIPFIVNNNSFQTTGSYGEIFDDEGKKIRDSKSVFKPSVVKDAFNRFKGQQIIWLDADVILQKKLDVEGDYDIGVARRPDREVEPAMYGDLASVWNLGIYNAGVIFFNPTSKASDFINRWEQETARVNNDQRALNTLLSKFDGKLKIFSHNFNSSRLEEDTVVWHKKGKREGK